MKTTASPSSTSPSRSKVHNFERGHKPLFMRFSCIMVYMVIMMQMISVKAESFKLEGIGYREQALQQAKGSKFSSEAAEGVSIASFAGGTHIFIRGNGLNDNPESNYIMFESVEFEEKIFAPLLTEDDAFNSQPGLGNLAYRLPSLHDLLSVPDDFVMTYNTMSFYVTVLPNMDHGTEELECSHLNNCRITYQRSYTPRMHYISPPTVYFESMTDLWFDPKWTYYLIEDLLEDEMSFINAKIGGVLLDFEETVAADDQFQGYGGIAGMHVTGQVGEVATGELLDVSMLWEVGDTYTDTGMMTHCTYDNQTCFQARTVPVIFDISSNTTYTTGGQNLTVTGYGFSSENIDAKIDGQNCSVTSFNSYGFSCEVQPKADVSVDGVQAGSFGLTREMYNYTEWTGSTNSYRTQAEMIDNEDFQPFGRKLQLSFEKPYNEDDSNIGSIYKGWFVAPATTNYRFKIACDDRCSLYLGSTPDTDTDPTLIIDDVSMAWNGRRYYQRIGQEHQISDWVALTEGESYYIQGLHYDYNGNNHFSVAVEIEQTEIVGHHHAIREVQQIEVYPEQIFDTIRVTISNMDSGKFNLVFQNANTLKYYTSGSCLGYATASQMYSCIRKQYAWYCGGNPRVNGTFYDADGFEIDAPVFGGSGVYYVEAVTMMEGQCSSSITVVKSTSTADIVVDLSKDVQLSGAPLRGNYYVECTDPEGYVSQTNDQNYWRGTWSLGYGLQHYCDGLYDKIKLYDVTGSVFGSTSNGRAFQITFDGLNADPGQFRIVSATSDPLTGENLTYNQTTITPYSTNIQYDPIPFEMLRTYENKTQLIVTVDGNPAVCHNMTCNMAYIVPDAEVTGFSFADSTFVLTVTGTNLPTTIDGMQDIIFADTFCIIDESSLTGTSIECTLESDPVCGDHVPVVHATLGYIPTSDLTTQAVSCSISTLTPSQALNLLGSDNITFTGTYFPKDLSKSTVSILFDDSQATNCTPQFSSSNELVCLTSAFNEGDLSTTMTPTLVINGKTVSHSKSLDTKSVVYSATAITPSSASPVLKTDVTIQLDTAFPFTLNRDDFTVNATFVDDNSYVRYLKVNEVDDTAKTLTCKFGGAESGSFLIQIRHVDYGLIKSELILDVNSYVTGFSPNTGSIYGGTLLTIQGTNFGDTYTDNPVQLSYSGGLGNVDCFVQTTSATEITCMIDHDTTLATSGQGAELIVFLKTSEEAKCAENACVFQYNSVIPTVESVEAVFDTTSNTWTIVVNGTDFTGDETTTSYSVNGVEQETLSVSSTQAIFTITDVSNQVLSGQKLLFDAGKPFNHTLVEVPVTLTPKLVGVYPLLGSADGTIMTLLAPGVTVAQQGLISVHRQDPGRRAWSDCKSTPTVVSYGVIQCDVHSRGFSNLELLISFDSTDYTCTDTDADSVLCAYEQSSSSDHPKLDSSASVSDANTVILTGVGFEFLTDFTPSVEYLGVIADSVVVDSDTQISATFDLGVPIGSGLPKITFVGPDSDPYQAFYSFADVDLVNEFSVSDSSSGLVCSFAGGCTYEVTSNSLANMIKSDSENSHVTICGEECVLIEDESSTTQVKCLLPALSTIYSNENFAIELESEDLDSGKYFGTADDNSLVFDGDLLVPSTDNNEYCVIGMAFKEAHVGMLSQVKWFMRDMDSNEKAVFIGESQFQGSNSQDSGYETLFTMDENMHSGWNYNKWEDAEDYPTYRYYRFYSKNVGGCKINEIVFTGVQTIQNEDETYTCAAKAIVGETEIDLNSIEYQGTLTTNLLSISPRYGTVVGGTEVTFSGENFPTDTSVYVITLDGINCPVSAATSTSVTCTTGSRPGLIPTNTELYITGQGLVSNNQLVYTYVSAWSSDTTWGGEFAPMEGESIWIPTGLNLLVDIDRTPVLNALIVEGSIIFQPDVDPNHHRYFDASYIFVTGGKMEVGTEQFPYTSKITITMHGSITDPYIPIFGNKCIGLRFGTLDMHGVERTPTWTFLESTVEAGGSTITLAEEVDWQVGETIAIAPTSFNPREGEHRTILAVADDKKTITLDMPLDYKHFAEIQWYGDEFIDTRAEVGLLSRNVVFRGDPETSGPNQYGATIFLHSQGDDSLTARLSYTEFTDMGQAFKLGRYAIHFHMIGAVHNSYAHGNAIHQSNNRAFTMHGTHYLRLTNNVVYEGMGHIFFIEDAIETNNICEGNLVIKVKRSWSLLNTDQSPAGFWITHPNNHIIGNHVGGSDRYGFWYDLQEHAMGPSANIDVCPENDRVGEFANNAAHTMGRYGLRIFHTMEPRTYPCQPMVYDESNTEDPFWQNPPIIANFNNFTGWKCNRDGAIAKKLGYVRFNNFKTADNRETGIQMSQTLDLKFGDYAGIFGALIIGQTNNAEPKLLFSNPRGVIGPRTENWQANDINFHNFNWGEAACFGSCSHCWHPQTSDQGAREYTTSGMYMNETTVTRVFKYGTPFNGIFHDLDGTLTGLGPDSWATHFEASHNVPECQMDMDKWDGHVCNSSVQVKGINFFNGAPQDLMGIGLKILPYDDYLIDPMTEEELEAYIDDESNYGTIEWKVEGWGVPFVTGHKYKIHFSKLGVNFENLDILIPQHYQDDTLPIHLIHNFTEARENIFVTLDGSLKANDTIQEDESKQVLGQNLILNYYPVNEMHLVINGKGKASPASEAFINLEAILACGAECLEALDEVTELEDFFRYWSDASNWPDERIPQEGDDVEVKGAWNMVLDVGETPVFRVLKVHGRLTFSDEKNIHLRARHISIRGGELHIGTPLLSYQHDAIITLHGNKQENGEYFEGTWMPGSKLIANAGLISFHGSQRVSHMTRLVTEVYKGDTQITVEPLLDWVEGDRIALAPTSYQMYAGEDNFITAYDRETGIATLKNPLEWHHWGQADSTAADFNGQDMRGEVVLLSRNVQIKGENIEAWGGRILTGDAMSFSEGEIVFQYGQTIMDNVEVYNCSQQDTYDAALGWNAATMLESSVTNSAIHNGLGWGVHIENSKNVIFDNNVMFNFRPFGLVVEASQDIVITNNVLIKVVDRDTIEANWSYVDPAGGYAICAVQASSSSCSNITVNYNIAAGITQAGFWAMALNCDEENTHFLGNVAHSVAGLNAGGHGAIFFNDKSKPIQTSECYSASYFTAYKCAQLGATSHVGNTVEVQYHHMTMIDNAEGFGPVCGVMDEIPGQWYYTKMFDNKIYGELSDMTDCPTDGSYCLPMEKAGMMLNGCSMSNRGEICTEGSCYPWQNLHGGGINKQRSILERNEFYNFHNESRLGMGNHAITLASYQSDFHPIHEFSDTYFYNVTSESMAYMHKPPEKWATMADCGEFPCTAPLNALFDFKDSVFEGDNIPAYAQAAFQVIPDNDGFSPYVADCVKYIELNGYACNNNDLGVLIFESEDTDKWDRSMQPIYISKEGTEMNNKLNSYMDHMWDGFYTGQVRLSRFPTLFEASAGSVYDITFTGTPAKNMLFRLTGGVGATIRIAYPGSESRGIYKDGVEISYNAWDDATAGYSPVLQQFCGENRFIGVVNILEFYITDGCELQIKPRNAIQTKVRMEWTLDEFFSGGGTTTFVDRITASLGIHASEVKIVSVYEGSLVINYEVAVPDDDPKALEALSNKQDEMFESGSVDLGAPVLEIESALVVVTEKQFTAMKEKVYVIDVDTTESDKAWRDSYITWDYEPIVIIPEDDESDTAEEEISNLQNYEEQEYIQDIQDRDDTFLIDQDVIVGDQDQTEQAVTDASSSPSSPSYTKTSIQNGEYQSNNVASQNRFEGAAVVTEETTIYQGVTVQVEKEPEVVYKYTKEQTVVVDGTSPEVVNVQDDNDKAVLIPIALSVVLVTIIAYCVKQLLNKSDANRLKEAEQRAMRIKNMNDQELSDCKGNVIDLGAAMKSNDYNSVNRDSKCASFDVSIKGGLDEQYYATQYDPSNDFAVFGIGDKTQGGVQSMKEKMNLADVADAVEEEESEDELSPMAAAQPSGHQALPQISNQKAPTVPRFIENVNDLPEDREIESDGDQE